MMHGADFSVTAELFVERFSAADIDFTASYSYAKYSS